MIKLNDYELEVLVAINEGTLKELKGSTWITACIEFLQDFGYITRTYDPRITELGKQYLEMIPDDEHISDT